MTKSLIMRELVAEIRRWARSANAGNFSHGSVTLGHEFFISQPNQRVIPVAFEASPRLFSAPARLSLGSECCRPCGRDLAATARART